jgi:chromosome partitioning protein
VPISAGTVERPSGEQPDNDEGLRWRVSTSGLAQKGLGWPMDGTVDKDVPSSGLGWPRSVLGVVPSLVLDVMPQSVPESGLKLDRDEAEATEGGNLPTVDTVSRETDIQGGVEHLSERDQLVASLPEPGSETPLAQAVAADARRRLKLTGRTFPKPDHTRILTVANQKGGVGKTTTTVNVAAALAQAGLRVLVVDIDPQGNASTALGIDHHADVASIYDVLVDEKPIVDVVQECADIPNLWCVPATIDLAGAEIELVSLVARETRMEKALSAYVAGAADRGEERLDYVLIDCPPSLGLLTVNAFVAADEVFIPIQCEYYALEGLSQLLKNIELIKNHLNPGLHVSTILLTMYDGRTRLSAQVAEEVRTHFPEQVLRTSVPRSVRISEAPSFGQTVMTYDPTSSGALSYLEAASELADRGAAGEPDNGGAQS